MTTEAAAKKYEYDHVIKYLGRAYAVVNPNDLPVEDLPVIYGFNNGGSDSWYTAQLIAEDGTGLGSHICSSEAYMRADLGVLEGSRPDRHESFLEHYPDGYRMDFVCAEDVKGHAGIAAAYALNQEMAKAATNSGADNE